MVKQVFEHSGLHRRTSPLTQSTLGLCRNNQGWPRIIWAAGHGIIINSNSSEWQQPTFKRIGCVTLVITPPERGPPSRPHAVMGDPKSLVRTPHFSAIEQSIKFPAAPLSTKANVSAFPSGVSRHTGSNKEFLDERVEIPSRTSLLSDWVRHFPPAEAFLDILQLCDPYHRSTGIDLGSAAAVSPAAST